MGRALGHARVTCLVLSDIAGHPEDVGSGPCSPDPGERLEHVTLSVVADNQTAVRAAVAHARALGWDAVGACEDLRGEASACGRRLGHRLAALGRQSAGRAARCLIWGGETTVRLGTDTVAPAGPAPYFAVFDMWAPVWKLLTPDASLKVRKGNYERIFDEGRRRVRAWEKANAQ